MISDYVAALTRELRCACQSLNQNVLKNTKSGSSEIYTIYNAYPQSVGGSIYPLTSDNRVQGPAGGKNSCATGYNDIFM